MIRVHSIPFSTNVERVALAAGIKGVEVEWIDHDPSPEERPELIELSGQPLVPVAEFDGGEVVHDSMRIVERLEELRPEPSLYPENEASRAMLDMFVDWFNGVWKVPPNAIDRERLEPGPDPGRIAELDAQARRYTPRFEAMLSVHPYLMTSAGPSAADVCAFPFLKYAVLDPEPGDDEAFHAILAEILRPAGDYPRLSEWVGRIDALPRA